MDAIRVLDEKIAWVKVMKDDSVVGVVNGETETYGDFDDIDPASARYEADRGFKSSPKTSNHKGTKTIQNNL